MTIVIEFTPKGLSDVVQKCEFAVASIIVSKHMSERMSKAGPNPFDYYLARYTRVPSDMQEIGMIFGLTVVVDYSLVDEVLILQGTGTYKQIKAKEPE